MEAVIQEEAPAATNEDHLAFIKQHSAELTIHKDDPDPKFEQQVKEIALDVANQADIPAGSDSSHAQEVAEYIGQAPTVELWSALLSWKSFSIMSRDQSAASQGITNPANVFNVHYQAFLNTVNGMPHIPSTYEMLAAVRN